MTYDTDNINISDFLAKLRDHIDKLKLEGHAPPN